jgi:hypothetical protein
MNEQSASPFLRALTGLGAVLGTLLALDGLHARFFGVLLALPGFTGAWSGINAGLHIGAIEVHAADLAWPMVVVGTMWSGALLALWLRLSWGYRACVVLGIMSLGYVGLGSLLAAGVLLLLRSPQVHKRSTEGGVHDGG